MKFLFEQWQQDGSRKLMGTDTTVEEAVEATVKNKSGEESEFDFNGQYVHMGPGAFAVRGTEDALGIYINEDRVVPPAYVEFEEEESESTYTLTKIEITEEPTKVVYTAGEALDLTGLVIKATYTDGTSEVSELLGVNEFVSVPENGDTLTTDVNEVVVKATEDNSCTDSFTITVNAAVENPDNGNA